MKYTSKLILLRRLIQHETQLEMNPDITACGTYNKVSPSVKIYTHELQLEINPDITASGTHNKVDPSVMIYTHELQLEINPDICNSKWNTQQS